MRVAVLGAGVIGVTTAYYLRAAGHEVVLVDRQPGPALETSFANAGEISPGYASPWAGPSVPRKAVGWLLAEHGPLIIRPRLDSAMAIWCLAMLRNCTHARYRRNKLRMVRLALYSQACLAELRAETGVNYDARQRGTLQLFRTQSQLDGAAQDAAVLDELGLDYALLDRSGCIEAEPGLSHAHAPIAGGLRLPGDETGDCYLFTQALSERLSAMGCEFRWSETIQSIAQDGARASGIETDRGKVQADAYVVALASYTPRLLRPLGVRTPIYPVKGYSLTATIKDESAAPQSTILDESYKVAITRLGGRIRIGGLAELAGYSRDLPKRPRDTLQHSADALFPCADLAEASYWSGLRPMTPHGAPLIGATKLSNLYINAGHGTLGWTMACGSAQILADMVSGKQPAIDMEEMSPLYRR
ncbi:MAG TPA: D-amino acid dehydrogenase [Terricaulis sp.]|nr:D-amino acid dehydrogenase [Terricaulis sp.]HRP09726.1 D-amino acid dehydrogenase [Terricaulis sp.]